MKRQWILVLFFLVIISVPTTDAAIPESTEFESDIVEGVSNRVYGVNLAREVHGLIDQQMYRQHVVKLTENGSRYIMDYSSIGGANAAAREWLIDEMQELSGDRLDIQLIGNYENIIATLPGYLPGDLPAFVITAHYDTVSGSPGANGDASGIAAILELIRVMSQYEWPLDIMFIAFNGHDSLGSMQGAREVANWFFNEDMQVLAFYNIDTILYSSRYVIIDRRIIFSYLSSASYHDGEYWADMAEMMGNLYGVDMVDRVPSPDFWYWESADSYQFITRGYENVLCAFENGIERDYAYHTSFDQYDVENYNYAQAREVTGYLAAIMAYTMGRAYGKVNHLSASKMINPGMIHEMRIAITAPTIINVSCRWFSGGATFNIYDPDGFLIDTVMHTGTSPWQSVRVLTTPVSQVGLYSVVVSNLASNIIGIEVDVEYDSDFDANGIMDSQEYWLDTALFHQDEDSDGICDAEEIILGTDLGSGDSDQDSLPDLWEIMNDLDPLDPSDASDDPDNDLLTNLIEYEFGLDPQNFDSDFDEMPDSWELQYGTNPLVNDAQLDPDEDQITNIQEFLGGTDPLSSDTTEEVQLWVIVPVGAIVLLAVGVVVSRRLDPLRE